MYEILRIFKGFFDKNSSLVIISVLLQIFYSIVQTIVIPYVLSGTFNNIGNSDEFKKQLIKLVGSWILIKVIEVVNMHYRNQIEPSISKFITVTVMNSIFDKYENDNHKVDIGLLIDKIHLIKGNLHDFSFLICTVFIPRIIVLFLSCINFFTIDKQLGITVFCCVIIQIISFFLNINTCVNVSLNECKNKDKLYEYIEDLFVNIDTIQSTMNGYEFEAKNLDKFSDNVKDKENATFRCVSQKQYLGYGVNIGIFSFILSVIYNLHKSGKLTTERTTTSIFLTIGLYDNMSEMSYYIPEFTIRYGVLLNNEDFLKQLVLKSSITKMEIAEFENYNIVFDNVTFIYPNTQKYILNKFCVDIPENKIVLIKGKSGSGKTTFIKLIFGVETPTEGSIMFGSKNAGDYVLKDIRRHISYITQDTNNLFNRTILENIAYGKDLKNGDKNPIKNRIISTIEHFGLYDIFRNLDKGKDKWSFLDLKIDKNALKLSGGQKKIIHMMRLEMNDLSKIIILDEPSNGLDEITKNSMIKYIKHLNSKGKTVIVISHDLCFENICHNIINFSNDDNPILD